MTSPAGRGRGAFAEARARVAGRLRARRADIEEAIFARVNDGVRDPAGAGRGDAGYVAGLRAAVAAVVDYGLTGIERGEGSSAAVPAPAVEQARRAARVGVGLDTVLRRYVAGHAVLEDFVMQEAGHRDFTPQRTALLREVLGTSSSLLDRLIAAVTSAYMREAERTRAGRPPRRPPGRPPAVRDRPSAGSPASRAHSQRERILQAMAGVVAERGFARATVKLVTARAGISSRTFYECFDGLEDCFTALLDLGLERAGGLITQAFAQEDDWRNGVRGALAALLVFFDYNPLLTRIWFIDAMAAGSWALEHRERNAALLRSAIVEHWSIPGQERPEPVAVTGVMASVLGLIHTHLVTKESRPLIVLLGPLMGLVTAPYLDTRGVEREIERGARLAKEIQQGEHPALVELIKPDEPNDLQPSVPGLRIPAGLRNPNAARARECLLFVAGHPDCSNREIARGIGVQHESQISRLLSRLLAENLAVKRSEGQGKRNVWRLTEHGEAVAMALL